MISSSTTENDVRPSDSNVEMCASEINTSRLQTSHSSVSSEGDLSFSLSIDQELDALVIGDELPAFEIRLISPLGRTPSPIDTNPEVLQTPTRGTLFGDDSTPSACLSSDFVTLQEINAQISPPADDQTGKTSVNGCNNLETIFEGVFLNTPPRKQNSVRNFNSIHGGLFEKTVTSKINSGKENQLPKGGKTATISYSSNCRHKPVRSKSNVDVHSSNIL
ncbi:uncharacterized protein LOC128861225 [Anastrepha ludens]|uniref:uncharacterized protein LOC128861225 n=1 Tax=Anastrepha ludens TaxID=28586 RepID=UPI0023B04151|nr:uncharacterized protein LOC128861225 [Anastrepha ludens]